MKSRKPPVGIRLNEDAIPISEEVKAACEILGLDPLYVANEGKLLAFPLLPTRTIPCRHAHSSARPRSRDYWRSHRRHPGFVTMKTKVGGERVVDMLAGEQLPRIC